MPVPEIEVPEAPVLLPIENVGAISWQGSAGAASYDVERTTNKKTHWTVIGQDISDAAVQYRPLFNDTTAKPGWHYYYRVKAKNTAGASTASNIVGPVEVRHLTMVDEMQDYSLMYEYGGSLSFESKEARKAKEDTHRLKGKKGSFILYKVMKPVFFWKLYSFFPNDVSDFRFLTSSDGKNFTEVSSERKNYYSGAGGYGV